MSRADYDDNASNLDCIRTRGAVMASIRGKRGQAFLRDLAAALDALPEHVLIPGQWVDSRGQYCALGAVAQHCGADVEEMAGEDFDVTDMARTLDIANALAREIVYINDEAGPYPAEKPEQRWQRVRKWVQEQIR